MKNHRNCKAISRSSQKLSVWWLLEWFANEHVKWKIQQTYLPVLIMTQEVLLIILSLLKSCGILPLMNSSWESTMQLLIYATASSMQSTKNEQKARKREKHNTTHKSNKSHGSVTPSEKWGSSGCFSFPHAGRWENNNTHSNVCVYNVKALSLPLITHTHLPPQRSIAADR